MPTIPGYLCNTSVGVRLLGNPVVPLAVNISTDARSAATPTIVTFTSADWSLYHSVDVLSAETDGRSVLTASAPGLTSQSTAFDIFGPAYCQ